ncbi:ATP-binding protein [Actinoallomurus sp. NPDC050550]|uniref:ATP-binding protein n=1 Tax=Actinoallomurus sp. NPDC050550 TaxID=3154937 RepID=UPI0034047EC7
MNPRIPDGRFPAKRTDSRLFPATPETAADARRWLTEMLGETHPACDDAVLLLSEAFTNSVRHSRGNTVTVLAFVAESSVRVKVIDKGGDTLPHYVEDPYSEGGRGLPIMQALAQDWGFEVLGNGQVVVWFDIAAATS